MVQDQYRRVWDEVNDGRLKIEEKAFGKIVAEGLKALEKIDVELLEASWMAFITPMKRTKTQSSSSLVTSTLKMLHDLFEQGTRARERAGEMVREVTIGAARKCAVVLDDTVDELGDEGRRDALEGLRDVLNVFQELVWEDAEFVEVCFYLYSISVAL